MMGRNYIPLISIFAGFTLIIVAISMQGDLYSFWSISSLIITIVGSFCALLVSFPIKALLNIPNLLKKLFIKREESKIDLIKQFCELGKKARKDGLLALEEELNILEDEFLKSGLQMVVDGVDPETIQEILELDVDTAEKRHEIGHKIFDMWGQLAPAFGMIGTLIGLITMLSRLDDSASIGTGMATALITTFYGALFANLVLTPIANNLRFQTNEESFTKQLMIEGIFEIQAGTNPRLIEEKLMVYLSPTERMEHKQKSAVQEEI